MKRAHLFLALILGLMAGGPALACPSDRSDGPYSRFFANQLRSPAGYDVVAGGRIDLTVCRFIETASDYGRGYFRIRPDRTIGLFLMDDSKVEFAVYSSCDTVLLVRTGAGNWFYDDNDGLDQNAMISLTRLGDGNYDIWVGTKDGRTCDARLVIETFPR